MRAVVVARTWALSVIGLALVTASADAAPACATSGTDPVTVLCDAPGSTITTTNTANSTSPNPATVDRIQSFNADLIGSVTATTTVGGYGLQLQTGKAAGGITFSNLGSVTTAQTVYALALLGDGGTASYAGNGSVSNTNTLGGAYGAIQVTNTGSGGLNFGTSATPITPTLTGQNDLNVTTVDGAQNVYINGGTIQATGQALPGGNGAVTLNSQGGAGPITLSLTGNTAITDAAGTNNTDYGVEALAGSGNVAVTSDANIGAVGAGNAFGGAGLLASSNSGDVNITQIGGTIYAPTGVSAGSTSGTTDVNIEAGTINATGTNGVGVAAGSGTTVTITTSAASVINAGSAGIQSGAFNTSPTITIVADGTINSSGDGIDVSIDNPLFPPSINSSSPVHVTANGTINAAGLGISIINNGTGSATVDGSGTVVGGIAVLNRGGDAAVDVTGPVTNSKGPGIQAFADLGGNVVVTTAGPVSGTFGIFTQADFSNDITISTSGNVTGTTNDGINALGQSGVVTVNVSGGTIAAGANGIYANTQNGTGSIVVDMTGGQIGTLATPVGAMGIDAAGQAGNVAVTATSIYSTQTGLYALIDNELDNGNLTVTANGTIDAANGNAIDAENISQGSSTITVAGTATAANGTGLYARTNTGAMTILIENGATVSGTTYGLDASALNVAGSIAITDLGTIEGTGGGAAATFTGTLEVGNGGTSGALIGNVVDGGSLVFNRSDHVTFGYVVSGTGTLTQAGSGILTVAAANTYAGATHISSGILQAGIVDAIPATSDLTVASGATFDLNGFNQTVGSLSGAGSVTLGGATLTTNGDGASTTFSGVVSGSGGLVKTGTGVLTLSGANSYTGATNVNAGTLQAGATDAFSVSSDVTVANNATLDLHGFAETIGSLAGAGSVTLAGGTLTTNGDNASTAFSGVISGAGGLTKVGSGTLTLSGANAYSGPTSVNAGTLQAGAANAFSAASDFTIVSGATLDLNSFNQTLGSLSGSGNVTLGSATLSTNADNASTTFAGDISGSGGLTKIGTGTLFLTGASTYSGATLVDGGVLDVNGSIANSNVTVAAGGTLKGNGTVGGVVVGNGATIAPGNSIGTIHVAGNVSFASGSTYQLQANAAGQADEIVAGGSASLSGGIVQVLAAPGVYGATTTYTILSATAGVSGNFASVTSNDPLLIPSLSYLPDAVDLTLTFVSLPSFAVTPNQKAVAAAIQGNFTGTLFNAVIALPPSAMPAAFDATSGEIHASLRSVLLESGQTLRGQVLGRLDDANDGPAVWGRLFGTWGSIGTDGNAATIDTNFSGATVGADTPVGYGIRVGVEGGYAQTQGFVGARASSLTADSSHFGLYAGWLGGPFVLKAGAIGSWGTARTHRDVVFPGFADADTAKQSIRTTQAFGEAGYNVDFEQFSLEPFANLGWIAASTGSFAEAGGSAALSGKSGQTDETFSTLGIRLTGNLTALDGTDIQPTARLAWMHAFDGLNPARTLAFEATGNSFTVLGVPLDSDQAVVDAGFVMHPTPDATIDVGYEGILSQRVRDNGLHASIAWAF